MSLVVHLPSSNGKIWWLWLLCFAWMVDFFTHCSRSSASLRFFGGALGIEHSPNAKNNFGTRCFSHGHDAGLFQIIPGFLSNHYCSIAPFGTRHRPSSFLPVGISFYFSIYVYISMFTMSKTMTTTCRYRNTYFYFFFFSYKWWQRALSRKIPPPLPRPKMLYLIFTVTYFFGLNKKKIFNYPILTCACYLKVGFNTL